MKKSILPAAILLFCFGSQCNAAKGVYAALGAGVLENGTGGVLIRPKQLMLRVGYDFNDYIGLGYEGSFSVIAETEYGGDIEFDTSFAYLKGRLPINKHASFYVLVGPADVELNRSAGGVTTSTSNDDTGFGFGIETTEGKVRFFIDHVTYFENDDEYVDSMNLGAVFSF